MQPRTALVTGGARGIPRAVAVELARQGFQVAICYRTSEADARSALEEINSHSKGLTMAADVSQPDRAQDLVERVRAELGPITVLVNGAGPYHRVSIMEETPEGWREMFDHNLHPVFYLSRLVADDMKAAGWGRIINFSMANADRIMAQPMVTAHFIAKSGILILTRTLAKTLAPHGITVNAVSPGYIDSGSADAAELDTMAPKIPAGRLGDVDDAVKCIRFLLSDESAYVNGSNLHLSGGWGI